jgi:hypothetical protein
LVHSHEAPIHSISVTNTSSTVLSSIILEIAIRPDDYGDAWRESIGPLAPGERWTISKEDKATRAVSERFVSPPPKLRLPFRIDRLKQVTETEQAVLAVTVSDGGRTLWTESEPLNIQPYNHWHPLWPHVLSTFVTPNGPVVQEIVRHAADLLRRCTGDGGFAGYQYGGPDRVVQQLAALHDTLVETYQLDYINPPASFEVLGQKVRFPEEVIDAGRGTCLDLTVLLAALAEHVGLHPILVLVRRHAFLACWTRESRVRPQQSVFDGRDESVSVHTAEVVGPDPDGNYFLGEKERRARELVYDSTRKSFQRRNDRENENNSSWGSMVFFNSTDLCNGRRFDMACDAGDSYVFPLVRPSDEPDPESEYILDRKEWKSAFEGSHLHLVDVTACRFLGIKPLPSRPRTG